MITPQATAARWGALRRPARNFTAVPTVPDRDDPPRRAVLTSRTASATAPQPYYAHRATRRTTTRATRRASRSGSTCPPGTVAVANGLPLGRGTADGRTRLGLRAASADGDESSPNSRSATTTYARAGAPRRAAARRDRRRSGQLLVEPQAGGSRPASSTGWRTPSATTRSTSTARSSSTRNRLRARDADALDLRHELVRRPARPVGPDDAARADARVVRQQRGAVGVERPVAQRGPRELVRVPLGRGARLPGGGHRRLAGRRPGTRTSRI